MLHLRLKRTGRYLSQYPHQDRLSFSPGHSTTSLSVERICLNSNLKVERFSVLLSCSTREGVPLKSMICRE